MAAGLDTAASLIAVITLSVQVAKLCTEYVDGVKNAKGDILRLTKEVEAVEAVFKRAQELLKSPMRAQLMTFQNVDRLLGDCSRQLQELKDRLDLKNQKMMRRIGLRSLKWPLESGYVDRVIQILAGYKQTISVALQVDQM